MASQRTYTIKVKAEKETTALQEVQKGIHGIMSILMLINFPLRAYHMLMRSVHAIHGLVGASAGAAVGPLTAESGAFGGQAAALQVVNAALRQFILLTAMATQGASLAGATAGAVGAGALIAGATVGTFATPVMQTGGLITRTGAAIVERGERVIPAGGGFGGSVSIVNNISVDPGGMDFTDFTNKMNESFRSALRGHVKSIPG